MAYLHDIFISYRRNPETLYWLNNHFIPLLTLRLEFELERKPSIYVDTQLEAGTSWPLQLGTELGRSRILLVLWTGNYLASDWCTLEFSHMLARERQTKRRTSKNPKGLVIPAMIHDGEKFPSGLSDIQYFEIQKCFNVRMAKDSKRAEELDEILANQAPAIALAINNAPGWRASWPKTAAKNMYKRLFQKEAAQSTLPRFAAR
jgi:hypothetical protein